MCRSSERQRDRGDGWAGVLRALRAIAILGAVVLAASATSARDKPTTTTRDCVNEACHASIVTRTFMHGPAAQQKCSACHREEEPRDHRFSLASSPEALCATCHSMTRRDHLHAPFAEGQCTGCHDPHGSDHPLMLVADPTDGLCVTCHADIGASGDEHVHGPVEAGACILCHEPHSSWNERLLTERPPALCAGCHAEITAGLAEARHIHRPALEGCTSCHDPHSSPFEFQLRQDAPELCLECHVEMRSAIDGAAVVHGAVETAGGCRTCHAAHGSTLPKLQKRSQLDLCLGCHDRPIRMEDGRTLTDMARLLRENPDHHGPIRDGACSACHQPHASEHSRLLAKAYPPGFYAPFEIARYDLCFSCHIPALVEHSEGTGLTRFRDGDRNLHWLHVNQEKGRTCRACHEVHASGNPFHVRDAVPFGTGGWALPIGFTRTPTGGSCAPGCHVERGYDRGGPLLDVSADFDSSRGDQP